MKFRFPLYAQIISVFVLNLILLGCLLFAFFGKHTNFGWKNFLYGSIGDRVQSMAMDIHWKLRSKQRNQWNSILTEFGDYYGVKLAVFDSEGQQVAGEKLVLPKEIQARIIAPHFRIPAPQLVTGFTMAAPVAGTIGVHGVPATVAITGGTASVATAQTAPVPHGNFSVATPATVAIPAPTNLPSAGKIIAVPPIAVADTTGNFMTSSTGVVASSDVAFEGPPHHRRHQGPPRGPFGPRGPHEPHHKFGFDHFMFGPPGGPPRFIINTKNPDRCWIGAMIPIISIEDDASTVEQTITTQTPATNSTSVNQSPKTVDRSFKKDDPSKTVDQPSKMVDQPPKTGDQSFKKVDHLFTVAPATPNLTTTRTFHVAQLQRIPMPGTLIAVTPNVWGTRLISDVANVFLMTGGLFCFSLVVWFPFVHQMTRALGKLTMATEEIADGKFDSVLTVKRWDEIGRLGSAINTMSSRLNAYVTGQKRFLGDIAHELCSPVARLQIGIELLETSSKPEQKATIQDIREEVEQMSMLINELLAFSKASVRGRETQLTTIDLTKILEETKAKIEAGCIVPCQTNSNDTPLSNQPSVVLNAQPGIYCLGDTMLIKRALENILRNAVRYAGAFGPITIDCTSNGDYAMISVVDSGPGVPEEAIESLGQPFYRPEESRSRSSGGVGLGLAIVKTCVEACNGSFSIRNMQPKGLRVDIILTASESSLQS